VKKKNFDEKVYESNIFNKDDKYLENSFVDINEKRN
jgi:hypothetical protein